VRAANRQLSGHRLPLAGCLADVQARDPRPSKCAPLLIRCSRSLLQAAHLSPIKGSEKVKVQAGHGRWKINATDDEACKTARVAALCSHAGALNADKYEM
jgi:hypothetical protein